MFTVQGARKRVVVTGVGTLSPAGDGPQRLWEALTEQNPAFREPRVFEAKGLPCRMVGEVPDLDTSAFPGRKSLWQISRSIAMGFAAADAALKNGGVALTPEIAADVGVVFGTTLGGLSPLLQLERQALKEGPRSADPMLFPSAGPSAPGCQISITLGMQGFNTTLSNGQTSGLDALQYAAQFIALGRAEMVLAGGVEEISEDTFRACCAARLLSGSPGNGHEQARPFDRRRNGFVLSEGAAAFLLENEEHAKARGARIHAEYGGYGFCFDASPNGRAHAAEFAIAEALRQAGLPASEIGAVFASANGSPLGDRAEAKALRSAVPDCPITAVKGVLGESYSAAGCLQAAAGMLALRHGEVPGTAGLDEPDLFARELRILRRTERSQITSVLINAFGRAGNHASTVIKAYVH